MKRALLLTGIVAVFLGSCIKDNFPAETEEVFPANTLRLYIDAQGLGSEPAATRALVLVEPGEDEISSLYLLFFEPDALRNGLFVDYVKINGPLTMGTQLDIDLHGTQINVTGHYHILAIANIDGTAGNRYLNDMDANPWMFQWVNKTESEVMSQARAWAKGGFLVAPNGLLMNSRVEKMEHQFHLNILLHRNQARFDVVNDLKQEYDLVSVEIRNAYPSSSIWNMGEMNYSSAFARIPVYYTYDNTSNTGPNGLDGFGPTRKDIYGHLYAFENQVPSPVQNDRHTTCLIIGLRKRTSGLSAPVFYYRANIHPDEGAQMLRRNNVYRLTIRGITDSGATDPQGAYENPENEDFGYVINYWDMDDQGMIVQDGSSVLSIPTKTVRIGGDGGTFSYSIFTFSNSTGAVSPLSITQSYQPSGAGMAATLDGNILIINAQPLGVLRERRGTITLRFAGLEASMNVIQADDAGNFLVVHMPNGINPRFAPYGNLESGPIRVEASGNWTAKIFMEGIDGFTFIEPGNVIPVISNLTISSATDGHAITNNRFRVYTNSANTQKTTREAFIVVSLDSDPEHYAKVFRLTQEAAGGVSTIPNQTAVTFNGMGTGLALVPNNATDFFIVRSGEYDSDGMGTMLISPWSYQILQSGGYDDRERFEVFDVHTEANPANSDGNNFKLRVNNGLMNTSGRPYIATLRIYLDGNPTKFVDITLIQQPKDIDFLPNMIPFVPKTGGQTDIIKIDADPSLTWTAEIIVGSSTAPDGRSLVQHSAKLLDKNNLPLGSAPRPMTEGFRVAFDKIYYPNRDIEIYADVKVTVAGMTKTIRINQTPLTSNGAVGYGMTGSPAYGGLGNTYIQGWEGISGTWGLAQIPGYTRSGVGNMNVNSIAANVTYLHVAPHIAGSAGNNYNWSVVNNFTDNRDAWMVMITPDNNAIGPMNNSYSPLKRNGAGYNNLEHTGNAYARLLPTNTKVFEFLTARGNTPLDPASVADFDSDATSSVLPGPWPSTAVVLMTRNNNTNHAMLVMDIKRKFLWIGESQIFWRASELTNNRGVFLDNLMYFIGNAMKYGSHFTDLLLESSDSASQPAPWDAYWGANAGVPSK
ncbi:MAG: hypothetical protein FWE99_00730 [Bacteroidales bacterium]|nr:hypothetical protein [Bacteroidales bacterium]